MASWLFFNTAQALAALCVFGLGISLWRLRTTVNGGHLIAFGFMLAGTLMRETVALHYGVMAWTDTAMFLSGTARSLKIIGALMFVRIVTVPRCGEWAWVTLAIAAFSFALVVPK